MAALLVDAAEYQGVTVPARATDKYIRSKNLEMRDDDILLCSFRKSGTHWTWEILNMILAGQAEYAKHWKNSTNIVDRPPDFLKEMESPRILASHFMPALNPTDVWNKQCKIIVVERNPKDCAVSFFCQNSKQISKWSSENTPLVTNNWNDFFDLFLSDKMIYGSWFDFTMAWDKAIKENPGKILKIHYEDLHKDSPSMVKKISEFIEQPIPYATCIEIADACNFTKLKKVSETVKDQTYHRKWSEGEGYFRKGIVGDWKNWFTVAQDERFKQMYEEKLHRPCPY